MPLATLLSLIDETTAILDDVATLTKVAAKKTTGVLGDDLALNAQQVAGVTADRELPVVWAVAKGSAINKVILVPAALAISGLAPWGVTPLLIVGGVYLCFEGVEKLAHKLLHTEGQHAEHDTTTAASPTDSDSEKVKIRGAIRTDFVLSAEIVVITLGSVADATFSTQVMVVSTVAALMTVAVYGAVAGIVKLDDGGLYLACRPGDTPWPRLQRRLGRGILRTAPYLMRTLSVAGTVAMFLVGGGILSHGIHLLHVWREVVSNGAAGLPVLGGVLGFITPLAFDASSGILAGAIALGVVSVAKLVIGRIRRH